MKKTEEDYKKIISNLSERIKELNCLYKIEEILNDINIDTENAIKKIIDVIPSGWQSPNDCCVKIVYNGKEYYSEHFEESDNYQTAYLLHDNNVIGKIGVYYRKNIKFDKENIFLFEEQKLLNTIADRLANFLYFKKISNENTNSKSPKILNTKSHYEWLKNNFHLSDSEILQLFQVRLKFKKGETLCKQGSYTSHIVFLTEGLAKVYIETSNNKNIIIKLIKPFDFIGLTSFFSDNNFLVSASTITASDVYFINKESLKKVIFSNPNFCSSIFNWYCVNYKFLFNKIETFANKQATARIAETLLYLGYEIFNDGIIDSSISRKDIAELSGMSVENAVRILTDLKNDKIIQTDKNIQIINEPLLRKLSKV